MNRFTLLTVCIVSLWLGTLQAQDLVEGPAVLPPPGYQPNAWQAEGLSEPPAAYPATALPAPGPIQPMSEYPVAVPLAEPSTAVAPLTPESVVGNVLLEEDTPVENDVWYTRPVRWIGTIPWDTGIELGINGASGSNESLSIRTGGYVKRETESAECEMSAYYNKTSANSEETQSNAKFDVRNDWILEKDSPWTLFANGSLFYDEFQAFDLQFNTNGGIGYRIVHTPRMKLTTRVGAGASREIGGPDDDWVPEAIFGLDLNQRIAEKQKLYTKLDYFPQLDGFSEFRLVSDVGWEIELVQPSNMSLKLSMTDRFDSTPNGSDPRLLNYSALLLWKL